MSTPHWLHQLLDGLETYEAEHNHPREGGICLAPLLEAVPADDRTRAVAYMHGYRAALETTGGES